MFSIVNFGCDNVELRSNSAIHFSL